ncbi:MAG TPA: hypothetical protein VH583_01890 [Vicinamibacterales bacterium]|jgi:hypothetical protein
MATTTIRCPVAQRDIDCEADFEGMITRVFCTELDERTGICRLKRNALEGGPLTQLLERVSEHTLDSRGLTCGLR